MGGAVGRYAGVESTKTPTRTRERMDAIADALTRREWW